MYAAAGLLVVPAGTLAGCRFAIEDPPAELEADRQDAAEELLVEQLLELGHADAVGIFGAIPTTLLALQLLFGWRILKQMQVGT